MGNTRWPPQVVVVGTDGSASSRRAAGIATSMARRNGAKLHILTVVRPPEGWWGVVGSPPSAASMSKAMADAQREVLDETVANLELDGVDWETGEEVGDPATALSEYCATRGADVLVVGRRGAGLIERLVMGSVADRVVHIAPCPVLIVPEVEE